MAVKTRSMIAKSRKLNLKKCRSGAYKKHRKSSVCRGVKRSTVCKRRKGCTHAKGKKRSFCRTRKNKKSRCDTLWWKRQRGGVGGRFGEFMAEVMKCLEHAKEKRERAAAERADGRAPLSSPPPGRRQLPNPNPDSDSAPTQVNMRLPFFQKDRN